MKNFIFNEQQLNQILQKLSLFPYKDVFQEINLIQQAVAIQSSASPEIAPSETKEELIEK